MKAVRLVQVINRESIRGRFLKLWHSSIADFFLYSLKLESQRMEESLSMNSGARYYPNAVAKAHPSSLTYNMLVK